MIGAPIATPSAYPVMSSPAEGMDTCKLSATSGSNPIIINSVIPIANAPIVSANSAKVGLLLSGLFSIFIASK
ncbi:hypothetical protein D3C76_1592640 [compost metagenome]